MDIHPCVSWTQWVIVARLRKEMEEKRAISDNQYGFIPGRSTENAMEKVLKQVEVARKGAYRYKNLTYW